jgi:hypothetical protein
MPVYGLITILVYDEYVGSSPFTTNRLPVLASVSIMAEELGRLCWTCRKSPPLLNFCQRPAPTILLIMA